MPRRFNPTRLHKDPVGIRVVDRHLDPWCWSPIGSLCRNSTEPIGGFDRPLKLAPGTNLLNPLISSRGRSKPTDRFPRIPTLGSHRIPTLGIRMSVYNPESDRTLSAGWIRSDSLSDSLTWVVSDVIISHW